MMEINYLKKLLIMMSMVLTASVFSMHAQSGRWSIYVQGGTSWATDVWYQNIDARDSYKVSPAVGGGIDYSIRPWVRIGAEYLYSRYRREQLISMFPQQTSVDAVKAYGNYLMNYHNAKVSVGFNAMELWPQRRAQWFSIWFNTGLGYMMARGNEYGIWFSTTLQQNGITTPGGSNVGVEVSSPLTVSASVQASNSHSSFQRLYLPASINIEADIAPQFTIGLKCEMDFVLNRKKIAPENLFFALATMRYNFIAGK